jgi:hypothetical protein
MLRVGEGAGEEGGGRELVWVLSREWHRNEMSIGHRYERV